MDLNPLKTKTIKTKAIKISVIKTNPMTFIPATLKEMECLGWTALDVILVTGDALIDSSCVGVAVIGRILLNAGYRVGMISQPDISGKGCITRLGEPELFWGVSAGCVDSMIANYTASGKRRKSDDMTPGGLNEKRPDRAVIVYANLIRRHFKNTAPIVLGGVEASLRRVSHYDAWSNSVRRSILFDAKADILVYGMAEQTILDLADALNEKPGALSIAAIRGICYIRPTIPEPAPEFPGPDLELPDHDAVSKDKDAFARMFKLFYDQSDPLSAKRLLQRQDTRYLVQNPPQLPLSPEALDKIFELPYSRNAHPCHEKDGPIAALETIRFSLTTHRGCYGECRFCAITAHQGRHLVSRNESSILGEAAAFADHPDFKGIISDVGGPTANMYGIECPRKQTRGACHDKRCIFPTPCKHLPVDHGRQISLLKDLRNLPGVRKVFVASGIRYDLILKDKKSGARYLKELLENHISGQMKIAPEHSSDAILSLMGKPGRQLLEDFIRLFSRLNPTDSKKTYLTYYMMAAYPGCRQKDMEDLRRFCMDTLRLLPRQTQIFTPSPSTYATLAYFTEKDPASGKRIFVEKDRFKKERQKAALTGRGPSSHSSRPQKPHSSRPKKTRSSGPQKQSGAHESVQNKPDRKKPDGKKPGQRESGQKKSSQKKSNQKKSDRKPSTQRRRGKKSW